MNYMNYIKVKILQNEMLNIKKVRFKIYFLRRAMEYFEVRLEI